MPLAGGVLILLDERYSPDSSVLFGADKHFFIAAKARSAFRAGPYCGLLSKFHAVINLFV
jgi:hypothetical protein